MSLRLDTRITVILASLLSLSTVPLSLSANANPQVCGKRDALVRLLNQRYEETRRATGYIDSSGLQMELYVSPRGTWTLVQRSTDDFLCVVATGKREEKPPRLAEQKSTS